MAPATCLLHKLAPLSVFFTSGNLYPALDWICFSYFKCLGAKAVSGFGLCSTKHSAGAQ